MPLRGLFIEGCLRVHDLSPLKGMPLTWLSINGCARVTDLTPLENMQLTGLLFTPIYITKGMDIVRNMETIRWIGVSSQDRMSPATFWKKYDAGEFK